MDWLGVSLTTLGTIASLFGAYIAFKQANEAKQAVVIVRDVEKKIKHHRATSDISKLNEKVESIISKIKVYGPGGNPLKFGTTNHSDCSEGIQDVCLDIRKDISCFSGRIKTDLEALLADIEVDLVTFNLENNTEEQKKESGGKILTKFSMINSKLRGKLNSNVERGD
jgi:hypothetical protein